MTSFCNKPCLLRPAIKAEWGTLSTCVGHLVFKGLILDAYKLGISGFRFVPCLTKPNYGVLLKPSCLPHEMFCQHYQLARSL